MKTRWSALSLAWALLLPLILGGASLGHAASATPSAAPPGLKFATYDAHVGHPIRVANLTVFPIYADTNPAFVDTVSLEHALAKGDAKVREIGDADGAGASVGTVVIENRGTAPVIVLAGTVIKGGNQDRQIAQDFVVAGKDSVDVEAFCVEQGRWQQDREGKNTGGKFAASGMLAPRNVRKAAQHDSDQGKVWEEVSRTNKSAKKRAKSDTLMATLDASDVKAKRTKLARTVLAAWARAPAQARIVGLAYAIDGSVRGARWFATRQLFEQHRAKLLETAALEAIMAPGDDPPRKITARQVRDFVDGVGRTKVRSQKKRKKTLNTNFYKRNKHAGASEARVVEATKNDQGELETTPSAPVTVDVTRF